MPYEAVVGSPPAGCIARGFHLDSWYQTSLMQLYCLMPMRFFTYRRAFATVSRYATFGLAVGLADGVGLGVDKLGEGLGEGLGDAVGSGSASVAVADGAAMAGRPTKGVAEDHGAARAAGATTTIALSATTRLAAAATWAGRDGRFNSILGGIDGTSAARKRGHARTRIGPLGGPWRGLAESGQVRNSRARRILEEEGRGAEPPAGAG